MVERYLPLACFGKLPFWREYLEAGAVQPTSRALKQWLHQGREALSMASGEEGLADRAFAARLRVLIGVPGSRELLAGVVRPSQDGGGRHFPFAVFTHLPRKLYGKRHALLPLGLVPVWEALDDAWDSLHAVATRQAFDETLTEHQAPEPAPVADTRGEYQGRTGEDAGSLFADDPQASLAALDTNMRDVLARLRESAGGRGVNLELPVGRDVEEACFQASFWIDLFNAQFRLRRYEPSVLLDADPASAPRRVFLKFGSIEPEDYLDVAGGPGETGLLRPARLPAPPAGEERGGADGTTYAALLGRRFG